MSETRRDPWGMPITDRKDSDGFTILDEIVPIKPTAEDIEHLKFRNELILSACQFGAFKWPNKLPV